MKQFGLIGKSLQHSFSKSYFTDKFSEEDILNAKYDLFELKDIQDFNTLRSTHDLSGLNVTIPYKSEIIPLLDDIDPVANNIGAVNTIVFKNNQCIGYNTDHLGFKKSIRPFLAHTHRRALILGTGGASKAVKYALNTLDISFIEVSRQPSVHQLGYDDLDETLINSIQIVINCTPLGTYPNIDQSPSFPFDFMNKNHLAFDLIYNPLETKFLSLAKASGAICCNGLNMLRFQAEESWKLWNS